MDQKTFIKQDPLTNNILTFLVNNTNNSFTVEDLAGERSFDASAKQIQLVMQLLMKEGMVRVTYKNNKLSYQIKT
jgi:hypothetical protein